ncbi:MAG: hypothetical protein ACRDQW_09345 [Haloechinothrix sp.]
MAYTAKVLRALISCPSDVDIRDVRAVQAAIARWNVLLGEQFGSIVVPVHWSEHASAAFGSPPQDILNEQLVDTVDFAIAIFWTRLGSPTSAAQSGTAEEITRIAAAGKSVSVLRCLRPVDASNLDAEQFASLGVYLKDLRGHALLLSYRDAGTLASQVDTILTRLVTHIPLNAPLDGNTAQAG